MIYSPSSTLLLLLLTLTSLIPSSLCWGSLGHRTVAYLALEYLTPASRSYANSLLNGQDVSDAALYADRIRDKPQFRHTAPWHYIDARDDPPFQCGVNITRDCAIARGCIVSAIVNQTARIVDDSTTRADKGQALRFLLHFFGDIHQPLHTEAEGRGGNDIKVRFGEKRTNLHAVWDSDIPIKHAGGSGRDDDDDDEKATARAWAKALYAVDRDHEGSLAAECQDLGRAGDCSLEWADEANQWICDYVLKDDVVGVEGKDLSTKYYVGAVPIVDLQVGRAGRRMAAWINALAVSASEVPVGGLDGGVTTQEVILPLEDL